MDSLITDRWITPDDYMVIDFSLRRDQYHQETKPEFFFETGTFCKVYEDDSGPIMFVRGAKSLRLDIQFVDNRDFKSNRKVLLEEFPKFAKQCKEAGFKELVFDTTSPLLKRFCINKLGFEEIVGDELRFQIK